jgi:hypothetical protein
MGLLESPILKTMLPKTLYMKDKLKCDSIQYRRNVNEWLFKRGKLLKIWLIIFIHTCDSLVWNLGGGIMFPLLNELSNWLFFEERQLMMRNKEQKGKDI